MNEEQHAGKAGTPEAPQGEPQTEPTQPVAMSLAKARAIRKLAETRSFTQQQMAEFFGVSKSVIASVVQNTSWCETPASYVPNSAWPELPPVVQPAQLAVGPQDPNAPKPQVRTLVVPNSHRTGVRTIAFDAKGRFAKTRSALAESESNTKMLRDLMRKPGKGTGKQGLGLSVAQRILELCLEAKPEEIGGIAKAFEIVSSRAWGRVPLGDVEQDRLVKSGVTVVVVPPPENMMHPEPVVEKPAPPLTPSWVERDDDKAIEAEVVVEYVTEKEEAE